MQSTDTPYNRALVLENLGGDEELFMQIAGMFIADWPRSLAALRAALAASDAATLRSAAHSIKGAVANFCAERAVQMARDLEMTGKTGDLAQAPRQVDATIAAVDEVVAALKAELGG